MYSQWNNLTEKQDEYVQSKIAENLQGIDSTYAKELKKVNQTLTQQKQDLEAFEEKISHSDSSSQVQEVNNLNA